MSPSHWGPPIWALFHTMAEKVKEESFQLIGPQLFNLIKQICQNLPCPDCANHATAFLNKVNVKTIQTKTNFKMMLCVFHNSVNKRKDKPVFNLIDLEKYAGYRLPEVFQIFAQTYNKKLGNLKLMSESMARTRTLMYISDWFKQNHTHFNE